MSTFPRYDLHQFSRLVTLEHLILIASLIYIVIATYCYFVRIPYLPFTADDSGMIVSASADVPEQLVSNASIARVNGTEWPAVGGLDFLKDEAHKQERVEITLYRSNNSQTKISVSNTFSLDQLWSRLASQWVVALVFWLIGAFTVLFIRPRDSLWMLFVAFNLLTALWMMASTISGWYPILGTNVFLFSVWLSVPVYWHLHLRITLPPHVTLRPFLLGLYLLSGLGGVFAIFDFIPTIFTYLALIAMMAGSLLILILLGWQRRGAQGIRLIFAATGIVTLALTGASVSALLGQINELALASLLLLPLLPLAYLYAIFRFQLSDLQIRSNRIMVMYLLAALIVAILFPMLALVEYLFAVSNVWQLVTLLTSLAVGILVANRFPAFQQLIERHLLGVRLLPNELLENFVILIATSLRRRNLVAILTEQVLPTLFIRSSALIQLDAVGNAELIYTDGLTQPQLDALDWQMLSSSFQSFDQPIRISRSEPFWGWLYLLLPVRIDGKLAAVWLLGNRDPDDVYFENELTSLNALATQICIALTNIQQRDYLLSLYQSNVERQDAEKRRLARELHDEILNEIGVLSMVLAIEEGPEHLQAVFRKLTGKVRQTIHDLRPAMYYGLVVALEQFHEELLERSGTQVVLRFEIDHGHNRYPEKIELHVFQIIKQAVENALAHAEADVIVVRGEMEPNRIAVVIEDDGCGFEFGGTIEPAWLLKHRKFGIVGMLERAELIDASVLVSSHLGEGTQISLIWDRSQWDADSQAAN